jgi:tRNA threonylcarbamoyladenosine biosynthesis protein TsaB
MKEKKQLESYIIALETATEVSSVAVYAGDTLLGSLEYPGARRHAKLVTVMMETLLRDLEIDKRELAAVAVAKGPGSYTGLRVGVSTAKGLAMALDLPLISVNSLEGLAWQVRDLAAAELAWICPLMDARRMEVYCAMYDAEMIEQLETQAKIIEEGAFEEILKERRVIFVGNGAEKCKDLLSASANALILPQVFCTARSLGPAIWKKFQATDFEDLVTFEPFYLKEFIAVKAKNPLIPTQK